MSINLSGPNYTSINRNEIHYRKHDISNTIFVLQFNEESFLFMKSDRLCLTFVKYDKYCCLFSRTYCNFLRHLLANNSLDRSKYDSDIPFSSSNKRDHAIASLPKIL